MNGLPYYKAYPRDFIEGTIGMPFELKGAYRLVLDLIYMQGGRLPDDPRYISGLLGCSVRAWNGYRAKLIEMGKLRIIGEFLTNYRADKELESLAKLQDKQRENRSRPNKSNGLQSPKPDQPEPEPEPDTEVGSGGGGAGDPADDQPPVVKSEIQTLRERILVACKADPETGLTSPNGTVLGTRDDMEAVAAWQSDLALTDDQILAVIQDAMSRKRDGPPSRLSYFDRPMQREAGKKSRPKLTPIEGGYDVQPTRPGREAAASDALRNALDVAGRMRRPSSKDCF